MKILITGGSGFIGRNLVLQYGIQHHVVAPKRAELNLLEAEAVSDFLQLHHFDAIIHGATERSNRGLKSSPDLLERNCRMFFHLASNSKHFGRMLFLSSGAVYDREHWQPRMPESYCGRHIPSDPYGFSKYLCSRSIAPDGNIFELRLFGVFGPYEDWRVRFISNACCRAVWGAPLTIRQNVFFDYLDVEDLGWLLEAFLNGEFRHRQYNLCTGRTFDLQTLAEKVIRVAGKPLEIKIKYPGLGTECSGDNARMMEEIPDFQFRDMDDSIVWLYRWYQERKSVIDCSQLRFDG
jgi:UDP-glucose 4-epimerase